MVLHQYDYLFAFGLILAFLDAWNIGANDVANSFATSVSSRSLTLWQAMCIATVMEFLGAVLVGARVAETIKGKIVNVSVYENDPAVLMLAMVCALVGSATWLTFATRMGMPVSTTHSIVGAIIGSTVAAAGASEIEWGWANAKGVSAIISAWFIAPGIAGGFAAVIFLLTKYLVLERKHSVRNGLLMIPVYFAVTSGILTMVIVWKGAPVLDVDDWTAGQTAGCIFGVAGGVVLLYFIFLFPYLYRKVKLEDWTLSQWQVILGPALWFRGPVPEKPEGVEVVQNYYRGHTTRNNPDGDLTADSSRSSANDEETKVPAARATSGAETVIEEDHGPWYKPKNWWRTLKWLFLQGVMRDVVAEQSSNKTKFASFLAPNIGKVHRQVKQYDNKTEHLYSLLQVLTASTASFAHGSNDVANAIGPLTTIYTVWKTGSIGEKGDVPIWVLVFGGAAISIGLWTFGYHMIRQLGNRLTLHSPSRGFSMELGASITVVLASQYAIPVSTTQCITGATVGVGACSGTLRAINWRMVAWIYMGWFITLPVAGLISGCLMGIIINAPRWGYSQ